MLTSVHGVIASSLNKGTRFLAVLTPIDYATSNTVRVNGGSFEVDWGDGIFLPYADGDAIAVALNTGSGLITVKSDNVITYTRFMTDTFSAIDIQLSKTLTSLSNICFNLGSLVTFNIQDTSKVNQFQGSWSFCTSLTTFPLIDTSSAVNLQGAWNLCILLVTFPLINTQNVGSFNSTWASCNSLASFPPIDTSSGTNFGEMFSGCEDLACLSAIDTRNATITTNMFLTTTLLTNPNAGEQTQIENGFNYINANACP